MRTTSILLICALTSLTAHAQKPASYHDMTRQVMTCSDVTYSCQALIPQYARQNKTDSLRMVLQLWTNQCQESERILRMKILLSLKDRTFHEEHYKDTLLGLLTTYRLTVEANAKESLMPHSGKDSLRFNNRRDFDAFTADFAHEISKEYDQYTLEFLLAEYYSRNFYSLHMALLENRLPGTFLQARFNAKNATEYNLRVRDVIHGHAALICEYWIPRQGARILGDHIGAGLQVGLRKQRFSIDWTLLLRFGSSQQEYEVYSQGALKTTRHFFGEYFGADMGHRLWHDKKSEVNLLSGIGYDGIEAIEKDSVAGVDRKFLSSLCINAGIGYRYIYGKRGAYVGLQTYINSVNYFNKGGTDLNGYTVSMRLTWGLTRSNYARNVVAGHL